MTEAEKGEKILSAKKDADTLKSILEQGNFIKAVNTVEKIARNIDYADTIFSCRVKHKIPYGNMSFGSLSLIQQRNVVIMLLEAVEATLVKLSLSSSK